MFGNTFEPRGDRFRNNNVKYRSGNGPRGWEARACGAENGARMFLGRSRFIVLHVTPVVVVVVTARWLNEKAAEKRRG